MNATARNPEIQTPTPAENRLRRYFYLKLGEGNQSAESWLSNTNPWGRPVAMIFFDNLDEAQYAAGKGNASVKEFRHCGSVARESTVFVVIAQESVWFLAPAGPVRIEQEIQVGSDRLTPKAMPVTILKKTKRRDLPAVLASMGCNQKYTRNAFTKIDHWGDLKAIDMMLGLARTGQHWTGPQGAAQVLECLSSTAIETLVARILEAQGCFVPAFVGGTMADVDIFAENDRDQAARLAHFAIAPGERAAIQVKMWRSPQLKPPGADCIVGLDVPAAAWSVGPEELLQEALKHTPVEKWLRRSLSWLPSEFLERSLTQALRPRKGQPASPPPSVGI